MTDKPIKGQFLLFAGDENTCESYLGRKPIVVSFPDVPFEAFVAAFGVPAIWPATPAYVRDLDMSLDAADYMNKKFEWSTKEGRQLVCNILTGNQPFMDLYFQNVVLVPADADVTDCTNDLALLQNRPVNGPELADIHPRASNKLGWCGVQLAEGYLWCLLFSARYQEALSTFKIAMNVLGPRNEPKTQSRVGEVIRVPEGLAISW